MHLLKNLSSSPSSFPSFSVSFLLQHLVHTEGNGSAVIAHSFPITTKKCSGTSTEWMLSADCTVHLPKQKGRELPPQTLRIMQELEKDLSPIPALLTSLVQCSLQPSPTVLLLQLSPMLSPFFLPSHVGQNGVYFGCNEKCFLLAAGKEAWLDGREVDTERKANRLNWGKWAS